MVPSSPNGPCSSGKTTSTSPSAARHLARLEHGRAVAVGGRQRHDDRRRSSASTSGSAAGGELAAARARRRRAPSGRRGRCRSARRRSASRSSARITLAAVAQRHGVLDERPPKTRATRGLRAAAGVVRVIAARALSRPSGGRPERGPRAAPLRWPVSRRATCCPRHPRRRPRAARPRRRTPASNAPLVFTSTYVAGRRRSNYARARQPDLGGVRGGPRRARGRRRARLRLGHGGRRRRRSTLRPARRPRRRPDARLQRHHRRCSTELAERRRRAGAPGRRRRHGRPCAPPSTAPRCSGSSRPTNPLLEVADLPALVAAGPRARRARRSSTTPSPPRWSSARSTHGADVVVHSVTKYLAGHSDVLLGAVVTAPTEPARLRERLRPAPHRCTAPSPGRWRPGSRCAACAPCTCGSSGPAPTPASSRARLAQGPPRPCGRGCATPGFGAIVADRGAPAAPTPRSAVARGDPAVGARHQPRRRGVAARAAAAARRPSRRPCPEALVRLSVGIEDVEDLWRDLDRALLDRSPRLARPRRPRPCAAARAAAAPRPPRGGAPPCTTATTCSMIGTSTPCVAGQLEDRLARLHALGGLLGHGDDLVDASCPCRGCTPKVRLRDSGDMQVAMRSPTPGQPGEGHRVGAERHAEPGRLGEPAGDDRRLGVVAHAQPLGHADRERDDVLDRAAELGADDVGVGVGAEVGRGAGLARRARPLPRRCRRRRWRPAA